MIYEKYEKTYIALTQIRSSQIIWVFRNEVKLNADDHHSLATSFLMRQYLDNDDVPDVLLLSEVILDEAFLQFLKEEKVSLEYPQIWPKKDLLEFTRNQLREYAYKRELETLENKTLTRDHMVSILARLGYTYPEKWDIIFECYDISHTDGHFTYASRVTLVNGKPDTNRYKKYKIKTLEDGMIDDFASHREVMVRRTIEWLEYDNFPHLIIIDGGKGQLSSALFWIKEGKWNYYLTPQSPLLQRGEGTPSPLGEGWGEVIVPICSIAKREEEIFLPWKKEPILFEKGTPELMVIQKARDESHRFSIGANKSAHMKSMKKNILEELPWFGPVTRKKILKLAGSLDNIKGLSEEQLLSICTIHQIETLRDHGLC